MAFKRYARSAFRKGKRVYRFARKNPKMAAAMAQQALAMAKQMRGIINSEKMYTDNTLTLGAAKSTITPIVALSQGDGAGNRTGNSILVRSIYLRGYMQVNPAVTGNTRISLVLVQDKQQISDTTPAITDLFVTDDPESFVRTGNTNNSAGRFKIILRKNYNINPNRPNVNIDKFLKTYTHIKFNGTASTDIQKNGLYLMVLTSESTNFPTVSIKTRCSYYDN